MRAVLPVLRVLHDESGLTLVEAMLAALITSFIAAVFYSVFFSFSDNILSQERRALALDAARPVVASLVIELRQAVDIDRDGAVAESLDSGWSTLDLVFYSDRFAESDGPEEFHYSLANCSGSHCDLMREVTPADAGSSPNWTYTGTGQTQIALENVLTDGSEPLFSGVSWVGGTETEVLACGGGTDCDFEIMRVRLRVDPDPEGIEKTVEIHEEVRFRNAVD